MTTPPALAPAAPPRPLQWHTRGSLGRLLVTALYVAFLVASPWLVRFAFVPDHALVIASQVADPVVESRCATAPELGPPCAARASGAVMP